MTLTAPDYRVLTTLPELRELQLAYAPCPHTLAIENTFDERVYAHCRSHRGHAGEHQWVALTTTSPVRTAKETR